MAEFLAPELQGLDLSKFMMAALEQAEIAGRDGELPIGAVVVIDGNLVSRGRARHNRMQSQIRHAELNALLDGGERLWHDYQRAILFTTVEPCPMCLGAAVMADVPHVVFALRDKVVYTRQTVESNPYVRRHIRSYYGGVLAEASQAILARHRPETLQYILNGGS